MNNINKVSTICRLVFLSLFSLSLLGCATATKKNSDYRVQRKRPVVYKQDSKKVLVTQTVQEFVPSEAEVESEISKMANRQLVQDIKKNNSAIKPTYNKSIEKWVDYFSVKDRARFQRFLDRGEKYRSHIEAVLSEHDLPIDLYYLAMIESGFVTHAVSKASAVGVWQMMKGTARDYGLEVGSYVDERRDHLQATEAAASFLRDLYNSLGSWDLAIAAYNCGESRVRRNVRRGRTRSFWELKRRKLLPPETRDYLPKFMAALIIGKNPEKFGFRKPQRVASVDLRRVKVPGGVRLNTISHSSGIPVGLLKKYNPHLRRNMTPRNKRFYEVWVPQNKSSVLSRQYASLKKKRSKYQPVLASKRTSKAKWHTVRSGQNLTGIARTYKVSVSYLKRINRLSSSKIHPRQKILVSAPQVGRSRFHIVRKGESLGTIARHYGRSVASLIRINNIRGTKLLVGQRLNIQNKSYSKSTIVHKVRRGENLSIISKKYAAHVQAIKKTNRLKNSKIFVGQKLKIPVAKSKKKKTKYRVRPGDNLMKIAKNFGTSIRSLKSLNGLRGSKIYVGQLLKISSL